MADLNFLNVDTTCTGIEIDTPTTGLNYLEYVVGLDTKDFSSIKSYKVKVSSNCCPETEYILPVPYAFNLTFSNCVDDTVNTTYDVAINFIDKNLVSTVEYQINGGGYIATTLTAAASPTINISFPTPGAFPTDVDVDIKLTNLDGFEYIISDTLTLNPDSCTFVQAGVVITYPDPNADANIDIDLVTGHLNFNTLIGSDPALSGVYQVIVCEETLTTQNCVQNHYFIECTIKCDIINKLVQCKDSDIMFFYDALVYSNDCTTSITYSEVCSLFELLIYKLETDGCYSPFDDCNCSGTTNIFPTRNNNSTTTVRGCGCS
jgi:hypothetical protein